MRIKDFKVLTFDCYGTLIDWESGIIAGLKPLTDRLDREVSRDEILASHACHESRQQSLTPGMRYADILATVYRRLADEWGASVDRDECVGYGKSIENWPAFPDSAAALRYLKRHFRLVILSNVDNAEHAPHLAQPDSSVSDVMPASRSIAPSGSSTDCMNPAVGAGCSARRVPEMGTKGTTKG